jgi:hypothetical protein
MNSANMFITHPPYVIGENIYTLGTDSLEYCKKSEMLEEGQLNLFSYLSFFNTSKLNHDSGN